MSPDRGMMPIAATRREVAEQPAAIARALDAQREAVRDLAARLAGGGIARLYASGSGDSYFAAQAVRLAFERYAGIAFEPLQAYEYAAYGLPKEPVPVAHLVISSSGRFTTTWDALDRALASGAFVVGVTDNPDGDNPFVSRPHVALVPGARKEGWPTQTTTATIAVLIDLAIALGAARRRLDRAATRDAAGRLRALPDRIAAALDAAAPWAARVADAVEGRRFFTLVGGGPGYAVAQVGTALLAEGPQLPAVALPVEEFHHALRVATLESGDPLILVATEGDAVSRARDTARVAREWGATLATVAVGESGIEPDSLLLALDGTDEPMSPLLALPPLHVLSLELAERRVAAGHERPASVPQ